MPLYEYHCNDCHGRFDALVSFSRPTEVQCRECESANVRRLVSTFAMSGGYDDQIVASEAPRSTGGCCGGHCGCGH